MLAVITLGTLDLIIIGSYILALLLIGLFTGKGHKKSDDLFLGGRSLTWPKIGLSLFSTNVSPMMLIGFAGLAYQYGIVGANFEWLAWIYLLILAMIFIPHYQQNRISTMPGFLNLRYGSRAHAFLSYYSLTSITVIWLGCSLYAGGLIISQALNIPIYWAVGAIALIAMSYTAIGGLSAVVRTDIFQSVLIIVGSVILTVMAYMEIGGFSKLYNGVQEDMWHLFKPASHPEYPWHAIVFGYAVVAIFFWCTDQTIVQKVLAAKNIENGQKGALFTSFLKIIMPVIFIFPGIMCLILYPGLENSDEAYLTLVTNILPSGMVGLIVAVLLAALINTIAAGLNSFSTVFTLDLYEKIFPETSESKALLIGRIVTLAAAFIAVILSILFSFAGKGLFEIAQGLLNFFAPPLSVVFLVGVLWKRATPIAAEITLIGGGILCFLVGLSYYTGFPNDHFWPNFLILSFYLFLFLLLVMIVVSLLTKPVPEKALPAIRESYHALGYKGSISLWKYWFVLACIMLLIYIIFN